jgi:membrane fusion protein, heavy metal efflux system
LKLAQQNYQRYLQITNAEIRQAQSQVSFAQEKYDKDQQLAREGALPRRNALESQTQLAEAQANYTTANSKREVIEAEAQIKRAQSAAQVAEERLRLSDSTYNTDYNNWETAPIPRD